MTIIQFYNHCNPNGRLAPLQTFYFFKEGKYIGWYRLGSLVSDYVLKCEHIPRCRFFC